MTKEKKSEQLNEVNPVKITVSGNANKITEKQLDSLKTVLGEVAKMNNTTLEIKWFDVIS